MAVSRLKFHPPRHATHPTRSLSQGIRRTLRKEIDVRERQRHALNEIEASLTEERLANLETLWHAPPHPPLTHQQEAPLPDPYGILPPGWSYRSHPRLFLERLSDLLGTDPPYEELDAARRGQFRRELRQFPAHVVARAMWQAGAIPPAAWKPAPSITQPLRMRM